MVKEFLQANGIVKLKQRMESIRKSEKFIEAYKFPYYQDYTEEYMDAFHKYLQKRKRTSGRQTVVYKPKKAVVFRKVDRNQVDYLREMMKDPKRRNLSLDQKQLLL